MHLIWCTSIDADDLKRIAEIERQESIVEPILRSGCSIEGKSPEASGRRRVYPYPILFL